MGYFQEKYEQSDFNLGEYLVFLIVLACFMYYTCLITPGLEDDKSLRHPHRHRSSNAWCVVKKRNIHRHRQQPSFIVAAAEIPNSVAHENIHTSRSIDVTETLANTNHSKTSKYPNVIPHKSVTRLKMSERELFFEDEYFEGTSKDCVANELEEDDFVIIPNQVKTYVEKERRRRRQ